jgi:hypothetical protein
MGRNEWKFMHVQIVVDALLDNALSNDIVCGRVASHYSRVLIYVICTILVTFPKNWQITLCLNAHFLFRNRWNELFSLHLIQKLSPLTQLTHCLGIPIYWN